MKSIAHKLVLPADRLPDDTNHRHTLLNEYFGDLLASAHLAEDGWIVELKWPDFEEFFVDPEVPRLLNWWKEGMSVAEMREAVVWSGSGLLSLDDAWTLYAWSLWLNKNHSQKNPPNEIAIVHVDDHRDMMCPRIGWDGGQWKDMLLGRSFSVFNPDSVRSSILSGAIGVGSFFTPFIHQLPRVIVRHLSQSAALAEDSTEWSLLRSTAEDTIISPGYLRPCLSVLPMVQDTPPKRTGEGSSYRFTRTIDRCLADLPSCPVLLHIDMDYFNNRYDRDSDWRDRPCRLDPSEAEVLKKIDEFFEKLDEFGLTKRVENVAVALSPGFFPAEYWIPSVERIERHLQRMGHDLGRGEASTTKSLSRCRE